MCPSARMLLLSLLLAATAALADDKPPKLEPVPEPPPPPANMSDAELEPDVTIVQRDEGQVEEYRVRGKLYMIKVTPKVGKPYYLIDAKGNGVFAPFAPEGSKLSVPMWLIKSW